MIARNKRRRVEPALLTAGIGRNTGLLAPWRQGRTCFAEARFWTAFCEVGQALCHDLATDYFVVHDKRTRNNCGIPGKRSDQMRRHSLGVWSNADAARPDSLGVS